MRSHNHSVYYLPFFKREVPFLLYNQTTSTNQHYYLKKCYFHFVRCSRSRTFVVLYIYYIQGHKYEAKLQRAFNVGLHSRCSLLGGVLFARAGGD